MEIKENEINIICIENNNKILISNSNSNNVTSRSAGNLQSLESNDSQTNMNINLNYQSKSLPISPNVSQNIINFSEKTSSFNTNTSNSTNSLTQSNQINSINDKLSKSDNSIIINSLNNHQTTNSNNNEFEKKKKKKKFSILNLIDFEKENEKEKEKEKKKKKKMNKNGDSANASAFLMRKAVTTKASLTPKEREDLFRRCFQTTYAQLQFESTNNISNSNVNLNEISSFKKIENIENSIAPNLVLGATITELIDGKGIDKQAVELLSSIKYAKQIQLPDGRFVTLFHYNHQYYCVDSACFHKGGPLLVGDIEELDERTCIKCPIHNFRIDLKSGELVIKNQSGPTKSRVCRRSLNFIK
eukprot:TRINITY_DN363_c3_g1_i2.p1 TRINITY_DN363_c3_g1~~TRINITY_DN363_c3_g1_i2.p1  ORF type:complete len:359 (-),score=141.78 TRINITY_DN363_c3_g1_i2:299-1375(-)